MNVLLSPIHGHPVHIIPHKESLDMLEVAKQSEHPRAYEVVGNIMKQLADMNQQLLDIHQQKQKLDVPNKKEQTGNVTTNNAIFVGSTNDLSRFLNNMNSEK